MNAKTKLLAVSALSMPLIFFGPTAASAQGTNSDEEEASGRDVIIVTARKREESLQTVPISISAFDEEAFDLQQIADVKDLNLSTPNVSIVNNTGTTTGLQVYIRGVGQDDSSFTFESPIGIYIDDVYIGRQIGGLLDIVELERVEVLRGPQGTLYGRNSSGGALKYVTKRPDLDETWGRTRATIGNLGRVDLAATVSVPVIEGKLAAMVTVLSRDREGFITAVNADNEATGEDLNALNQQSARVGLLYTPTDDWEIYGTLDYFRDTSGPQAVTSTDCTGFDTSTEQCALRFGSPFRTANNVDDINEHEQFGGHATAEYTGLSFATVRSITAYRTFDDVLELDLTGNPAFPFLLNQALEQNQFTQELQFLSTNSGPFSWVTGAYFFTETVNQDAVFIGSRNVDEQDQTSYAVFGEARYEITPSLAVFAGARYTSDEKDIARQQFNAATDVLLVDAEGSYSSSLVTPRFGVEWQAADNIFAFVTYGEGYKPGGFANARPGSAQAATLTFDDETVDSYEAGLKTSWFDNRVIVNATVFQSDYTNLQQSILEPEGLFAVISGDARFRGLDLEITARPTRYTNIYGILGLLDDEWITPPPGVPITADLKHAPEHHFKIGAEHTIPAAIFGLDLALNANVMRTGEIYRNVANTPNIVSDPYTLIDAAIILRPDNDQWRLALEGRNLGDEEYWEQGISTLGRYYAPPRTVAVSFQYRFGALGI